MTSQRAGFRLAALREILLAAGSIVRRIPEMAISIGLVRGDTAVIGGVLNPITNEGGVVEVGKPPEFWGLCGHSAATRRLSEATASVSRTEHEAGLMAPYATRMKAMRPVGSVAYKLLGVAADVYDLTFSVQPKSEWDICGGVALLAATGKVSCRLDGEPLRFNQPTPRIPCGMAAGDSMLVNALLEVVSRQTGALVS